MKRRGSSDSLGDLMSICPASTSDERSPRSSKNNHMYSREFQSMLDSLDNEEGCVEESGGHMLLGEKKRRLSVDQVKALEKNFEVENKLEPERKVKLAQELGLQPRQVAVWFQNRRARWKTKQLERDYGVLKSSYDSLRLNYDALQHDNEALLKEIRELKAKLNEENTESNVSVKEEEMFLPDSDDKMAVANQDEDQTQSLIVGTFNAAISETEDDLNYESLNSNNEGLGALLLIDNFKDGSSSTDSDSSAILNEESNNNDDKSRPNNSFQFARPTSFHAQLVKMEEHDFFSSHEEACDFFSDEQAPTLHWYCPDQWNYYETS